MEVFGGKTRTGHAKLSGDSKLQTGNFGGNEIEAAATNWRSVNYARLRPVEEGKPGGKKAPMDLVFTDRAATVQRAKEHLLRVQLARAWMPGGLPGTQGGGKC